MSDKIERIAVGRFGRTRGVRGDIYLIPYGDYPERILNLKKIEIDLPNGPDETDRTDRFSKAQITKSEVVSKKIVAKIVGYDTPETARTLTNRDFYIPTDQLEGLPDGEHYAFELEGCSVELEDGTIVGELKAIECYPTNDMYVIEDGAGKSFHLPAIKEFVLEIDIKARKIIITPPEGLIESQ